MTRSVSDKKLNFVLFFVTMGVNFNCTSDIIYK